MNPTRLYELLQTAFQKNHQKYPFPKTNFNNAPSKIIDTVNYFTDDLNRIILEIEDGARVNAEAKVQAQYVEVLDDTKKVITVLFVSLALAILLIVALLIIS